MKSAGVRSSNELERLDKIVTPEMAARGHAPLYDFLKKEFFYGASFYVDDRSAQGPVSLKILPSEFKFDGNFVSLSPQV